VRAGLFCITGWESSLKERAGASVSLGAKLGYWRTTRKVGELRRHHPARPRPRRFQVLIVAHHTTRERIHLLVNRVHPETHRGGIRSGSFSQCYTEDQTFRSRSRRGPMLRQPAAEREQARRELSDLILFGGCPAPAGRQGLHQLSQPGPGDRLGAPVLRCPSGRRSPTVHGRGEHPLGPEVAGAHRRGARAMRLPPSAVVARGRSQRNGHGGGPQGEVLEGFAGWKPACDPPDPGQPPIERSSELRPGGVPRRDPAAGMAVEWRHRASPGGDPLHLGRRLCPVRRH
jgi:hypothetical protein